MIADGFNHKSYKMAKNNKIGETSDSVKLIRKSNELVEARYKFDIWEVRVFAKALTLIKQSDVDFKTYDIFANISSGF